ncbi:MAG: DUF885 domain-containing protein [Eubacterium sp.]
MKRYFALFLTLCLLLCSCAPGGGTVSDNNSHSNTSFREYTDALFCESVSSDALSLNYSLAHPEHYGISKTAGGFAPLSVSETAQASSEYENALAKLEDFDKKSLSEEEQILYDNLKYTLDMNQKGEEFFLFSRPFSPVTGLQAQLPVLLAEYTFDCREDIDNYFALLRSIPSYFESVLVFYDHQEKAGLLPCRSTISHILEQCQTFLSDKGWKLLLTSFRKRIEACEFIDQEEMLNYRKENKSLIKKEFVHAYENLVAGLTSRLDACPEDGALCKYQNGEEYYRYLFASETGSSCNPEDYLTLLKAQLKKSKETLLAYAKKDASLFANLNTSPGKGMLPEQQLNHLTTAIKKDFPEVKAVQCKLCYVDKSLEDYLSPAFYLTPPLDAYDQNVIYINGSDRFAGADLYTTLAHEGYPGHLYQNVYDRSQDHPLLSYALNFNGYTEGWATYAEIYSYKYLGYKKEEIGILRNNMIVSLCLYGICDIAIHLLGWGPENVYDFLTQNGSYDRETSDSLYENIIDEPGSYLKYTIGYMEFARLKKTAKTHQGNSFSEKEFHQYVLSAGPSAFSVLEDHMTD